jgi:hypothetical protein
MFAITFISLRSLRIDSKCPSISKNLTLYPRDLYIRKTGFMKSKIVFDFAFLIILHVQNFMFLDMVIQNDIRYIKIISFPVATFPKFSNMFVGIS